MRLALVCLLAVGCSSVTFLPRKPTLLDRPSLPGSVDSAAPAIAATMPTAGGVVTPRVIVPTEARLTNGIRVIMLEEHSFPLVALGVVLARGEVDAPPGAFDLFMRSLTSGSDLIAPKALHRTLYEYGTRVEVSARKEESHVEAQFLAPLLADVVRMVVPTFATPTFDSEELDKLLDERRRAASRNRDEPGARAVRELYKLLYPAGHPYAQFLEDSPAPLANVTVDTVRAMRSFVGADDVSVVVTGDFTPARLLPLLEQALHTLKPGATASKTLDAAQPPLAAHVLAIDHPHDTQARLALGFLGVKLDDPDYVPLYCLARIIGADAKASLRVEHGLTYGASGTMYMMRMPAPVEITAAVNVAGVGQALRDTFGALNKFQTLESDFSQLERAKSSILSNWPDTFETVTASMRSLATLAAFGLPADTWIKWRAVVQNLTADDLVRVAKKYLDKSKAQLVVLGDVARFKADIDALGIAEVEVRSAH